MRSHHYEVNFRDWVRIGLPLLGALVLLAGLLQGANRLGLLPRPAFGMDPTSTVLVHQLRAARSHQPGEIVLLGDSTCMMDVDAPTLASQLPGHPSVINLALIISFDLGSYAQMLSDFCTANPGQVRAVVLLVSPRKLTMPPNPEESRQWRARLLQDENQDQARSGRGIREKLFGTHLLRENLLSHCLTTPLRGQGRGAGFFGFPSQVDAYMTEHHGSLIEFGTVPRQKKPEHWDLHAAPALDAECAACRAGFPSNCKLLIGLTPIPQSYSSPDERLQRKQLLAQWGACMKADAVLTNLPPTLPDVFFASQGHLNQVGQQKYTRMLARELGGVLRAEPGGHF